MMAGFGPTELVIVLVILLLLFGAKKLPALAGALGKSIREFRQESKNLDVSDVVSAHGNGGPGSDGDTRPAKA